MKVWYSIFNFKAYASSETAFYCNEDFEWTEVLEKNWLVIKAELETHLSSNPRLVPNLKRQKVNYHGSWKTMPLMTWSVEFHKNICNFPKTTEVLKQIPGLVSISFNLLEKQSEIKQHYGDTNASVRVHLGLKIPKNLPDVGFEVKGIQQSWQEGKVLIFCDGFEHSAWNHSNEDRYILLLDIIRPEFIHKRKWICGNVLASLALQSVTSKSTFWGFLFLIPLYIIHFFAKLSAIIFTPIYNLISRNCSLRRIDSNNE